MHKLLSIVKDGEEQVWTLEEPLRLTVHLEFAPGEDEAKGRVRFVDPTPLMAVIRKGPLEPPAIFVHHMSGETESPLEPHPLLRLEGASVYDAGQEVWVTTYHAVTLLDPAGKVVS